MSSIIRKAGSCPYCVWKTCRSYILPNHIMSVHYSNIDVTSMSGHYFICSLKDSNISFVYCPCCQKGSYSDISSSSALQWITKHSKNTECKNSHQHHYEEFKKLMTPDIIKPVTPVYKKKSIPKTLRFLVWDSNIGKNITDTNCLCCGNTRITQRDFHCGHIIPESKGGQTCYDNLLPICSICNLSMGTENMKDFKERNGFGMFVPPKKLQESPPLTPSILTENVGVQHQPADPQNHPSKDCL